MNMNRIWIEYEFWSWRFLKIWIAWRFLSFSDPHLITPNLLMPRNRLLKPLRLSNQTTGCILPGILLGILLGIRLDLPGLPSNRSVSIKIDKTSKISKLQTVATSALQTHRLKWVVQANQELRQGGSLKVSEDQVPSTSSDSKSTLALATSTTRSLGMTHQAPWHHKDFVWHWRFCPACSLQDFLGTKGPWCLWFLIPLCSHQSCGILRNSGVSQKDLYNGKHHKISTATPEVHSYLTWN